ncbi:MAG: class I SAM-dependent methyltransferase [Polyangiaceae bacterium]|nr:class I SAM-dependent methyltransferase [Myxococcales bacterium]MCB9585812.1 class I SAM-dependent methyltransferase [Polyangiaceae bacterium]MCB9607259.1 class I SAM-dependent methyltransferase [Polyangiaceae bacterium]
MGRIQLFEFFDLTWVPGVLRQCGVEYLAFIEGTAKGPVSTLAEPISRALEMVPADGDGRKRVVDLCSGAAGPWPVLLESLPDVSVTCTDLHPNLAALERAADRSDRLKFERASVNALEVPNELVGARTIINGFHHFPPAMAAGILQSAVDARAPIAVLEMTSRSALHVLTSPFIFLACLLVTPFVKPFRLSRLLFTYLIPLLPWMIWWDGLVSGLRVYSEGELKELVSGLNLPGDYTFEVGSLKAGPLRVPYLVGKPSASLA